MARLLLIAPTCDGEDVGEAWIAHQWAHRLARRHEVTLLTYHKRGAKPASQQLPGLEVIEWREPPLLGRAERLNSMLKPAYIPFYFRARRWIRAALAGGRRFDLAHQPVPVAMRYPSPAAGLGIPLVIGPVGGGLSSPRSFEADESSTPWFVNLRRLDRHRQRWDPLLRRTFGEADCILGIAAYVEEQLAPISPRRFEVVPDTALDLLPDPIERSGRRGPLRLLFVGRLVRTKGVRDAIKAMALMPELPVRLDIVGEGPQRAACETLITQAGLAGRVTLHGWHGRADVARFYREADIFVFPSYREPGGTVVMEAMGFSLPLIVVDRGGPGSNTTNDCAIKLPVTTPQALAHDIADAIRRLAADEPLRLKMGAAARMHVAQTGLWSAKLDRMDTIYAEIMQGRPEMMPAAQMQSSPPRRHGAANP